MQKKSVPRIVCAGAWYAIPVFLSLCTYAYQLASIPGWNKILTETFLFRTGMATSSYNTFRYLAKHLYVNLWDGCGFPRIDRCALVLFLITFWLLYASRRKAAGNRILATVAQNPFLRPNRAIIVVGMSAPVLHLLLLRNHSAIHEFSSIKFGWCLALLIVVISSLLGSSESQSKAFHVGRFAMSRRFVNTVGLIVLFCLWTGVPLSSYRYRKRRFQNYRIDYSLARILHDVTDYTHVCFSFSHEIKVLPPQELAVSGKRVYKIQDADELQNCFPTLPAAAVKILVVEKKLDTLSEEQRQSQNILMEKNRHLYEDDDYCLVVVEEL